MSSSEHLSFLIRYVQPELEKGGGVRNPSISINARRWKAMKIADRIALMKNADWYSRDEEKIARIPWDQQDMGVLVRLNAAFAEMDRMNARRQNPPNWYEMGFSKGSDDWKAKNVGLDTGDPDQVIKSGFDFLMDRAKAYDKFTPKEEAKSRSLLAQGYWDGLVQKKTPVNRRRRNPEESAAEVFEGFHGAEPETILEYRFEEHEHENLAGLGDLVELIIHTPFNKEVTIKAPDPESGDLNQVVKLCCSEDRTQLYFVGGEQEMPVEALEKMGFKADANDLKDLMLLGVLMEVTYRTKKGFDNFKLVDYYHGLGEETGVNPVLLYDYRSGLMRVAGGQYVIEDRGIVN
jgi:hypothetical protein